MKKIGSTKALLIAIILLSFGAVQGLSAQTAHDPGFKLGLVGGYPSGVSIAYRFDKDFEMNGLIGTNWGSAFLGTDALFRLADVVIGGEILPLSLGPAAYIGIQFNSNLYWGAFVKLHWEYTFKRVPFNVFIEIGGGASSSYYSFYNSSPVGFDWISAAGFRIVFDHPSMSPVVIK